MDETIYKELDKAWKSTCRVVLGDEIGELTEYQDWLREYLPPKKNRTSHISGKPVSLALDFYSDDARFISAEELKEASSPLDINKIKDLDSISEAISEKWEYSGSRVFGNSKNVELSDFITGSHYVSESSDVTRSSNIFACTQIWDTSKSLFGCTSCMDSEFAIRNLRSDKAKRVFEIHFCIESTDAYVSSNCFGCKDIMFSFNQRFKRNCIGNLQLPPDKYSDLKKKLLGEIREELKKNKKFPSVFALVPGEKPNFNINAKEREEKTDIKTIEKAFTSTFDVLLKSKDANLDEYGPWLSKHVPLSREIISPFGINTYQPPAKDVPAYAYLPENRIVSEQELIELSKLTMDEADITSLDKIKENLGKIGFFTGELREGTAVNIIKSPVAYNSSNLYKMSRAADSTHLAFSSTIVKSERIFGSYRVNSSQFSINCYNSLNLNRCFEMDTSTNCSGAYFCHNSEGLQEAMFCWNTKGKRNAVANTELPKDKYISVKETVLQQLREELEKNKDSRLDIFNMGVK